MDIFFFGGHRQRSEFVRPHEIYFLLAPRPRAPVHALFSPAPPPRPASPPTVTFAKPPRPTEFSATGNPPSPSRTRRGHLRGVGFFVGRYMQPRWGATRCAHPASFGRPRTDRDPKTDERKTSVWRVGGAFGCIGCLGVPPRSSYDDEKRPTGSPC